MTELEHNKHMANNDAAVFLDLDNLVIGARDANLHFDVNLILDKIKELTNGRVVLRRAYSGNLRQDQKLMKELAAAGFTMQSAVPVNNFGKNLIDMYLVVEAMDTMVDQQDYLTYVLVTGDRDFLPLIHALRRRGKQVIGVGLRHASSDSLSALCDQYLYYEDLLPSKPLGDAEVEVLLKQAVDSLISGDETVRASVLKERMIELSQGSSRPFPVFRYIVFQIPGPLPSRRAGRKGRHDCVCAPGSGRCRGRTGDLPALSQRIEAAEVSHCPAAPAAAVHPLSD
ncbi:MAG: NYN domain-containing protein [Chloroflexota bacterium]